jgi:hypothetical protein
LAASFINPIGDIFDLLDALGLGSSMHLRKPIKEWYFLALLADDAKESDRNCLCHPNLPQGRLISRSARPLGDHIPQTMHAASPFKTALRGPS